MKISTTDRKKFRIRNKLKKVSNLDRFRLSIFRSSKNISAQIIDDKKNVTLLSVSSIEKDIKSLNKTNKTELSKIVAEKLAKKAKEKQTIIKINGIDKQLVGTVAAKIKTFRPPEPYKGKGIKEVGQYILRKEGKKK